MNFNSFIIKFPQYQKKDFINLDRWLIVNYNEAMMEITATWIILCHFQDTVKIKCLVFTFTIIHHILSYYFHCWRSTWSPFNAKEDQRKCGCCKSETKTENIWKHWAGQMASVVWEIKLMFQIKDSFPELGKFWCRPSDVKYLCFSFHRCWPTYWEFPGFSEISLRLYSYSSTPAPPSPQNDVKDTSLYLWPPAIFKDCWL